MRTVEEIAAQLSGSTVFSTLDASSGFWHVQLDEPSSKLTTFNTPYGRYRFLRLPFGINSAPEVFQRRMTQAFEDIDGAQAIVDDILIWGKARLFQTHQKWTLGSRLPIARYARSLIMKTRLLVYRLRSLRSTVAVFFALLDC